MLAKFVDKVESVRTLAIELATAASSLKPAAELVDQLPRTNAELEALLLELAAVEKDAREHRVRHPDVREIGPDESPYMRAADPVACEADWRRICRRREAAVNAVTQYAIAIAEKVARETEVAS